MDNETRIAALSKRKYKAVFGVKKVTFDKMLAILEQKQAEIRRKGGRKPMFSVLDMLITWFAYCRDYRTMESIAFDYDCYRQRISEVVRRVTKTLVDDGTFRLPSKRELLRDDTNVTIAIVDVTEQEIERPKDKKTEEELLWQEKTQH